MKKLLLVSALCLPATAAFATGNGPNPPPFQNGNTTVNTTVGQHTTVGVGVNATNKNTNNNVNFNSNVARGGRGGQGGAGGTGGNALSTSTSRASGGQGGDARGASSNTNVNVTGDQDRLQAPALAIPGIAPGNNCGLAASAGLTFGGFGGGAAYSWEGQECLLIAWTATMQGDQALQLAIACQSEIIVRAMAAVGRSCPGKPPAPTPTVLSSTPTPSNLTVWRNGEMPSRR